jgi:hypothetical protein
MCYYSYPLLLYTIAMAKRKGEELNGNEKKKKRYVDEKKQDAKRLEYIEITTKGRRIWPSSYEKYTGDIGRGDGKNWYVRFRMKGYEKYTKWSLKSREDAETHKREVNERYNLPKNIKYEYKDEYYCILTGERVMKFSIEDCHIVDAHIWSTSDITSNVQYAQTSFPIIDNGGGNERKYSHSRFHQLIYTNLNENEVCDHINRDSLDNRRENLRVVNRTIQYINRGAKFTRKATNDVIGVSFSDSIHSWIANWKDENGKRCKRAFSINKYGNEKAKELALALRNEMETTLPHYKIALGRW